MMHNNNWNLKSRIKDLLFKLISFTGIFAIIATILLVKGYLTGSEWNVFMLGAVFVRGGNKAIREYKNGNGNNNYKNEEIEI